MPGWAPWRTVPGMDDDWAAMADLLDPADPVSVERRADLFALTPKTVHLGHRPTAG